MDSQNNIDVAISAGAALSKPVSATMPELHDGIPYVVVPAGYKVENLERLLPAPFRKQAGVVVNDSPSFIAYAKKHGSLDECVIYADIDTTAAKCTLIGIINDHKSDSPQWRDHRCTFTPKLSVEWGRWLGGDKKVVSQIEFATWLEDNVADIVSAPGMPTGAQMLEMALNFEANSDKRLRSKTNLQSGGVRLEFIDDETKETRTSMEVFQRFTIGIPVFEGSPSAYPLEARLKYREKDGSVSFWFELIRPDRVFKTAVAEELNAIKESTGFLILNGKP